MCEKFQSFKNDASKVGKLFLVEKNAKQNKSETHYSRASKTNLINVNIYNNKLINNYKYRIKCVQ